MVDDNLAHDRQAQAGTALAVGHVGVENVLALGLRHARTIVIDHDGGALAARLGLDADLGRSARSLRGLHGVFDQIGDDPPEQRPVAHGVYRNRVRHDPHRGLPFGLQTQDFAQEQIEIDGGRLDLGQLGEGREIVDQAAQSGDLLAQDLAGGIEQLSVRGIVAAVFAGQLLHGQLDWREWVLDLMGQPARDLLPGRHFLQVFEARTRLA